MKKTLFTIGILSLTVLSFTSCKDEKKEQAEKSVNNYVVYVDSVGNVAAEDAKANWEAIDAEYQARVSVADNSIAESNDEALREKLAVSKAKYEALKGDDMSFAWVNKDNILQVYQDFYDSYKANKENFSREDYDEVKLLYEALDARKNTVEKEGLSSEDNNKIASIKFRFAPMFKVNRIGAKADENQDAKDKAE
jgi:hypothetical protein